MSSSRCAPNTKANQDETFSPFLTLDEKKQQQMAAAISKESLEEASGEFQINCVDAQPILEGYKLITFDKTDQDVRSFFSPFFFFVFAFRFFVDVDVDVDCWDDGRHS